MRSFSQDTSKLHLIFLDYQGKNNTENLSNIDGIGITQIQSIKKFFLNKTNLKVLSELEKNLLIKDVILINNNGFIKK